MIVIIVMSKVCILYTKLIDRIYGIDCFHNANSNITSMVVILRLCPNHISVVMKFHKLSIYAAIRNMAFGQVVPV